MEWLSGDKTITILNRVKAIDSPSKVDTWYKTVVKDCMWTSRTNRTLNGKDVIISQSLVCRIPSHAQYKDYKQWVKDPNKFFTLVAGDYAILGEVTEEITPQNILTIVNKYKPDAFQINSIRINAVGILDHYKIEGV